MFKQYCLFSLLNSVMVSCYSFTEVTKKSLKSTVLTSSYFTLDSIIYLKKKKAIVQWQ